MFVSVVALTTFYYNYFVHVSHLEACAPLHRGYFLQIDLLMIFFQAEEVNLMNILGCLCGLII